MDVFEPVALLTIYSNVIVSADYFSNIFGLVCGPGTITMFLFLFFLLEHIYFLLFLTVTLCNLNLCHL